MQNEHVSSSKQSRELEQDQQADEGFERKLCQGLDQVCDWIEFVCGNE
jgi:hypothetical protein